MSQKTLRFLRGNEMQSSQTRGGWSRKLQAVTLALLGLVLPMSGQESIAQERAISPNCHTYDNGQPRSAKDPDTRAECGGPRVLTAGPVARGSGGSLTTLFASNNGFSGNSFDLAPTVDMTIDSFDVNLDPGTFTVQVYWRNGTANGAEQNAAGWNLLGSAQVTSNGTNVPTPVPVGGLPMTAGNTYGIIVTCNCSSMRYTNGAMLGDTFANSELTLRTFRGLSNVLFTNVFTPRQWNGTVYYSTAGFSCSQLGNVVGVWGINSGRCGNFTSTATVATYESSDYDGVAAGEYSYEVELISNRPRQPSATTSLLVNGSPMPLQTATQNWNRAIAFNISGNGKYSIFRYNGSGLPVAVQRWVTPVGVAINAAPTPNILRVDRVLNMASTYDLVFSINGMAMQTLAEPFPVDQFGIGFTRGIPTTVLGPNDSLEVLNVELGAPMQRASGQVETLVSDEQQRANNAANRQLGNDNPLFAPDSNKR